MGTGGVSNKEYFDFNIEDGSFQSHSSGTKPSLHGCALETLKKIENILKEDLPYKKDATHKEYLTDIELNDLQRKSSEIREGYKRKLSWFARTFFRKEKQKEQQVDEIYHTIQHLVEGKLARLKQDRTGDGPRNRLPMATDLMGSLSSFLDSAALANLLSVSSQIRRDVNSTMSEQAKEYGYTGPSIDAQTWVRILNQVHDLAHRRVIPDQYIIRKNGEINAKETMKELKKLTTSDLYAILSQEILYEPPAPHYESRFKEFLSTFHVQRGWRPQTSKMDDDHIRRGALALTLAVKYAPNNVVELLLEHGANPNIRGADGFFPIHWAARGRYKRTFELLLKNKALVNSQTNQGDTPLAWACYNGRTETVQLLLEHGADPNICNQDKQLPIHVAAQKGHREIVQMLLKNKALVDSQTNLGDTPLAWACRGGHTEIVQLLLESRANPNIRRADGFFPIHWAVQKGYTGIVELLLKNKALVNSQTNEGDTPLAWACYNGHTETAKLLLEHGADPNICDNIIRFPIHWAVQKGYTEIVQMLLRKGARVNVTNGKGQTPVDLALQLSDTTLREQMVALLLNPETELLKFEDPFLKPEAGE